MKGRIVFYFAAAVALVLFLAATSHATERRDPVTIPDQTQSASARATAPSSHARRATHGKKTTHSTKPQSTQASAQKKNPDGGAGTTSKGK